MRELNLNGYIDEEIWFGDEITPESLHESLYPDGADTMEDVHIRLNSYGGSCNAAVRMHDDLAAYPGNVRITVSGTAASAATVLAMAANVLEMTPGSLFMIHDPSLVAAGNEADLMEAVNLLRSCKDSIINVYEKRCRVGREQIGAMMRETTWMDAETALQYGFVDQVAEKNNSGMIFNRIDRNEAEKKVCAWLERRKNLAGRANTADREAADVSPTSSTNDVQNETVKEDVSDEAQENIVLNGTAAETEENVALSQTDPSAHAPDSAAAEEHAFESEHESECESNAESEQQPEVSAGTQNESVAAGTPVSQLQKRLALIMPREAKNRTENKAENGGKSV